MGYGFEILCEGIEGGLFDVREEGILRRGMDKQEQFSVDLIDRLPEFRGKGTIAKWLYALSHLFKKKQDRWIKGAIWK